MRIIRNKVIPLGRNYGAINLFGVLFVKHDMKVTPELLNHEMIHTCQMRELLFLPFYIIYVIEWLYRLTRNRFNPFKSYMAISFEKEAYSHGDDLGYLSRRRHFAQWREE